MTIENRNDLLLIEERDFVDVRDINADDLKAKYCIGKNAGRAVVGGYGIVIGRI